MAKKKRTSRSVAAPTIAAIAKALQEPFLKLDAEYDDLYAACKTDKQRKQLQERRDLARDIFWKAVKIGVEPGNALAKQLHADLVKANKQINAELKELKNITGTINFLTELLKTAASLAVLAAA